MSVTTRFEPVDDRVVARLDPTERAVIAGLIEQTRALLEPEVIPTGDPLADLDAYLEQADSAGPPRPSPRSTAGSGRPAGGPADQDRDPALARLLPDAHRADPQIAADFREMAEQDLRQRKYATFTTALEGLGVTGPDAPVGDLELSRQQAEALAISLTDVRLLISHRLGLQTEQDIDDLEAAVLAQPSHRLGYAFGVYEYLTYVQGALLTAITGEVELDVDLDLDLQDGPDSA